MKNVDDSIRAALSAEDKEWFDRLGEQHPIEQVIDSFTSLPKFYLVASFGLTFLCMGVSVFAAVRFFAAEAVGGQILWAGVFFVGFLGIMLMKIGYWMELSKRATMRELKRVELQVARLAEHLNVGRDG